MKNYTQKEWLEEGTKLFGKNRAGWKFKCPRCGTVQSAHDFIRLAEDREAMEETIKKGVVGFSCIGRYVEKKVGCDWTLGGFLQIHKAKVTLDDGIEIAVFEFATA